MQAVLLLVGLVVVTASAESCSYSKLCADHTMCIYQGPGKSCGEPTFSGVNSDADKQAIIDAHNTVRRKVAKGKESRGNPGPQPPAANMRKMTWDNELSTVAQRWADQCTNGYDSCRDVDRFFVDQNVYQTKCDIPNGEQDWPMVVHSWHNEVQNFSKDNVSPYNFTIDTFDYAQEVWADTYLVGCGFTAYSCEDGYNKKYVCNYGPGGNIVEDNSSMYEVGTACSQCSGACDDGLCV